MRNTTAKEYEIGWGCRAPPRSFNQRKLPRGSRCNSCWETDMNRKRYSDINENKTNHNNNVIQAKNIGNNDHRENIKNSKNTEIDNNISRMMSSQNAEQQYYQQDQQLECNKMVRRQNFGGCSNGEIIFRERMDDNVITNADKLDKLRQQRSTVTGLDGCVNKIMTKIMCARQSLKMPVLKYFNIASLWQGKLKRANATRFVPECDISKCPEPKLGIYTMLFYLICTAIVLLPNYVNGDDSDNFFAVNTFNVGAETTTPEFDYASRGQKKFGDKCENTLECGFPGSVCDPKKKSCQCTEDLPVTNHIDKCGKEAAVNESCFFNEQCEVKYFQTECRDGRCVCRFEMTPVWGKDGTVECKGRQEKRGPETYIDPAMIGVLIGMALMFIIICVVLRLFSQARWRENRTIFNTPNPRLMNVSLLRDSKLLHGQERRGSRMSVRAPSRQPSMASLRPHSPNPSLGRINRSKSNTRSSDFHVSDATNCSRLLEHQHNVTNASHIPLSPASAATITSPPYVSPSNAGAYAIYGCGSRSGSYGSASNASATSVRSTRNNSVAPGNINNGSHHERKSSTYLRDHYHQQQQQQQQQPLITNITSNPTAENVTVEIIEPAK